MRSVCWESSGWDCTLDACCFSSTSVSSPCCRSGRSYVRQVVESEGALALDIVVLVISKRVVRGDEDLPLGHQTPGRSFRSIAGLADSLAISGQLDRRQLLFIVFPEGWSSCLEDFGAFSDESFDVWVS